MDIKGSKNFLTKQEFENYSIWKLDDKDDLYYPVLGEDDFPENTRDLRIRADFELPCGIELSGYIVGLFNIFAIGIFIRDSKLRFNKNLPDFFDREFLKISKNFNREIFFDDFSPVKYETTIDLDGFRNLSGEIDFSRRSTIEESLRGFS